MAIHPDKYREILAQLEGRAKLVAVSKTKPAEDIQALYDLGQRDFGENYVQELIEKHVELPPDIRWHFIGHLQSNKVKFIASFVSLIHGVDSLKLLAEIAKQAIKSGRTLDVLLQVHIAREETKFGMDAVELESILIPVSSGLTGGPGINVPAGFPDLSGVRIRGLMGIASFTTELSKVREEFRGLKLLFDKYFAIDSDAILSMGMSADFKLAMEEGTTLVRIGSLLFGERKP